MCQSLRASEVKVRLYDLLSATFSFKCAQQFLYVLGFLCPYSAVRKALFIELALPGVELQHLVWAHFFLVTESGSNMALVLPTNSVSAEKWNNVFVLCYSMLLPTYITDSPVHSCSTLLIKAIFCNILFTLPTFILLIVIEISLGVRGQFSRMALGSDGRSGWEKQESRSEGWWW